MMGGATAVASAVPIDRPHPNPSPEGEGLKSRSGPRGEGLKSANLARGEAVIAGFVVRPSFAALVAAEEELGPLFALVERAADGRLALGETVALFWHCLREPPEELTRDAFGEAVMAEGLSATAPVLRQLLGQILKGQ